MRSGSVLWLVVLVACLAFVGWRLAGKDKLVDTDVTAVFSLQDENSVAALATRHLTERTQNTLRFAIGHKDQETVRAASARLASALQSLPAIKVTHPAPGQPSQFHGLVQAYREHAGGLLTSADRQALSDGDGRILYQRALGAYFGLTGRVAPGNVQDDPFLLTDAYLRNLSGNTLLQPSIVQSNGRYFSLLTAELPAKKSQSERQVVDGIEAALEALRETIPDLEVYRTGGLFFAEAQAGHAHAEVQTIVGIAVVGIVLLTLLVFRSGWALSGVLTTVGGGLVTGTAVAFAVFDQVHLFAVVFGTSLIGVAVDYGYHYYAHKRDTGSSGFRAGLTLGMVTSVFGFLCLGVSPMAILGQIAVYSASGLVGAYLTVLLLLPILPVGSDLRESRVFDAVSLRHIRLGTHPAVRAALILIVLAATVSGFRNFAPNDDLSALGSADEALLKETQFINALSGTTGAGFWVAVTGPDVQEILEREELLKRQIKRVAPEAVLTGIAAVIPSVRQQQENARLVRKQLIAPYGEQLAEAIAVPVTSEVSRFDPLEPRDMDGTAADLIDGFIVRNEGGRIHLVNVGGVFDKAIVEGIGAKLDNVTVVRPTAYLSQYFKTYRIAAYWALLAAMGIAAGVAIGRYGAKHGIIVFTVPAASTLLAFLAPTLLGGSQNFFTTMALFLVFAICADYALFFAETRRQERGRTYIAVWLSAGSSCLAFGLLASSSIPLVRDIGLVVFIGVVCAWILAPVAVKKGDAA